MKFHRPLAGIILFSFFPVSAAFGAGSTAADFVQIAYPQNESSAPGIGIAEPRVVRLDIDFASILRIEGGMSAIAVGNPDIVDASLADHRTVILTGRLSGTTNLIALDDAGRILADVTVRVSSQKPGMVRVRRGMQIQAYTCTSGLCEGAGNDPLLGALPLVAGTDG